MATVPFQDRLALTHPRTGVTVGLYPSSDPSYDLNLWRSGSTQGVTQPTSSQFSEIATLGVINGGAPVPYVDQLALSKTFWWYKVRSVRTNVATPSAFTTAVVSQSGILPTTTPGAIPYTGGSALRPIISNVTTASYRSSGSTVFPGVGSPTGTIRTWFINPSQLRAATSSSVLVFSTVMPATAKSNFVAARGGAHRKNVAFLTFTLPAGSFFNSITMGFLRKGPQSTASAKLIKTSRFVSSGAVRTLLNVSASSGGVVVFKSTNPRFWVQPNDFFGLRVVLDSSGGSSCAQFLGAIVTTNTLSLDVVPTWSP